jgi:hypothetical protein
MIISGGLTAVKSELIVAHCGSRLSQGFSGCRSAIRKIISSPVFSKRLPATGKAITDEGGVCIKPFCSTSRQKEVNNEKKKEKQ